MSVAPLLARDERGHVFFHAAGRGRERESEPVRDPEDVRVDRKRRLLENDPKGRYCYTAIHVTGDSILLGYSNGLSPGDRYPWGAMIIVGAGPS